MSENGQAVPGRAEASEAGRDGAGGVPGPEDSRQGGQEGCSEQSGQEDSGQSGQERRRAALRGARRVLSRPSVDATVGDLLARLAEDAGEVYDLGESVDVYGDGVVAEVERRVAALLGTEDAVFFPTGTMAQQVALRCWAGRTGNATVALHPLAHFERHERGAYREVSGLRTVHPSSEPRLPTADEVRDFEEPFGALMLELPLRDAGFVLPSWDELNEVVEAARERDAVVHVDGARLWECTPHFGRPLDEIAGLADSVYVSFYKSLGGLGGAALAGAEAFVAEARAWRHRYGGLVFQQFPTALSALLGLTHELPRLPSYVTHARVVAEALRTGFERAGVPWFRVHPEVPHTHQFQVWLPYDPDVLDAAVTAQAEETDTALFRRWFADGPPGLSVAEVTVAEPGLQWTAQDVVAAVEDFVRRL